MMRGIPWKIRLKPEKVGDGTRRPCNLALSESQQERNFERFLPSNDFLSFDPQLYTVKILDILMTVNYIKYEREIIMATYCTLNNLSYPRLEKIVSYTKL
jgi:hypothetical protein